MESGPEPWARSLLSHVLKDHGPNLGQGLTTFSNEGSHKQLQYRSRGATTVI